MSEGPIKDREKGAVGEPGGAQADAPAGAGEAGQVERSQAKRRQAVTEETSDHSSSDQSGGSDRIPGDGKRLLRTADVLRATGITHQVLYRYVTLGLIEAAGSTPRGQRLFHPDAVTLIEVIKSLNQSGYSLRDMKEIFFKDRRVRRALGAGRTRAKS